MAYDKCLLFRLFLILWGLLQLWVVKRELPRGKKGGSGKQWLETAAVYTLLGYLFLSGLPEAWRGLVMVFHFFYPLVLLIGVSSIFFYFYGKHRFAEVKFTHFLLLSLVTVPMAAVMAVGLLTLDP